MKLLRIFFTTVFLVCLVVGGAYAWQNKDELATKLPVQLQEQLKLKPKQVLGVQDDSGEKVAQTQATMEQLSSFAAITQETVAKTTQDVLSKTLNDDQKIEVEKAVQQAQESAATIPDQVFQRARYEYCKQVVEEYKK